MHNRWTWTLSRCKDNTDSTRDHGMWQGHIMQQSNFRQRKTKMNWHRNFTSRLTEDEHWAGKLTHSEHRFPAPSSSKEGCRKPVPGVWAGNNTHSSEKFIVLNMGTAGAWAQHPAPSSIQHCLKTERGRYAPRQLSFKWNVLRARCVSADLEERPKMSLLV